MRITRLLFWFMDAVIVLTVVLSGWAIAQCSPAPSAAKPTTLHNFTRGSSVPPLRTAAVGVSLRSCGAIKKRPFAGPL